MTAAIIARDTTVARLVATAATSRAADGIFLLGLPLAAAAGGGGSMWIGSILAAQSWWWLLAVPLSNSVERRGPGPVLKATRTTRLVLIAIAAVGAAMDGQHRLIVFLVVALAWGATSVIADTAVSTLPAVLLSADRYDSVYSMLYSVQRVANLVAGPALAAALLTVASWAPFVAAGVLLALSLVVQWPLLTRPEARHDAGQTPSIAAWSGFALLRSERMLASIVVTLIGIVFAEETVATVVAPYVRDSGLAHWESAVAVARSTAGISTIGIALAAGMIGRFLGRARALSVAAVGGVIAPLLLAVSPHLVPLVAALVISAAAESLWVPLVQSEVMHRAPPNLRARMRATFMFLTWGTLPLAGLLGGAAAQMLGYRPTLVGAGSTAALTSAAGIWRATIRSPRESLIAHPT